MSSRFGYALQLDEVSGLLSFWSFHDVELHLLALGQGPKAVALDG